MEKQFEILFKLGRLALVSIPVVAVAAMVSVQPADQNRMPRDRRSRVLPSVHLHLRHLFRHLIPDIRKTGRYAEVQSFE